MTTTRRYALVCSVASLLLAVTSAKQTSSTASKLTAAATSNIEPETVERATCVNQVRIEFEYGEKGGKLFNGESITSQWYNSQGLLISGSGSGAQILNTAVPGPNSYLGSPNRLCSPSGPGLGAAGGPNKPGSNCKALGNVLYVPGKYDVSRWIHFEFTQPRYVQSIGVLDIKQGAQVSVTIQTATGQVVTVTAAGLGDNAVQDVGIYKTGVKAMTVRMMTGAITHLDFCKSSIATTPMAVPVPAPHATSSSECQHRTYIGFDKAANGTNLVGGQYVMNEWLPFGVSVMAYPIQNGFTPLSKPRLFDTSKPGTVTSFGSPNQYCSSGGPGVGVYGEPGQLGQNCIPLGKVLIVQQSTVSTPDASTGGAVFTFRFLNTKTVYNLGLFNVPLTDTVVITAALTTGNKKMFYVRGMGKNGYQTASLNVPNAVKLTVFLPTSGAISHIDVCTMAASTPASSPAKQPVLSRVGNPSPQSIPIGTNAPSPYATVNDNGMFPPLAGSNTVPIAKPQSAPIAKPTVPISSRSGPVSTSGNVKVTSTPAPSPYATVNDNGMFAPH